MRAILIDPFTETVTEVDHADDYRDIYRLIDAECFDVVGVERNNALYVDDEGLLKAEDNPDTARFFLWAGRNLPLCGKALVLGTDDMGESVATDFSLEEVRAKVRFLPDDIYCAGFEEYEGMTDASHPMGAGIPIIGNVPVFKRKGK